MSHQVEEYDDLGDNHSPLPWSESQDGHILDAYSRVVVFFGWEEMPDNFMENRAFILQRVNSGVELVVE